MALHSFSYSKSDTTGRSFFADSKSKDTLGTACSLLSSTSDVLVTWGFLGKVFKFNWWVPKGLRWNWQQI